MTGTEGNDILFGSKSDDSLIANEGLDLLCGDEATMAWKAMIVWGRL
ncbi:MAG: hypothetical protein GY874_01065 [Desulfobacteraceae bacterium]|nr:hypothetical protein [Desulfobacteraceae bacterium]